MKPTSTEGNFLGRSHCLHWCVHLRVTHSPVDRFMPIAIPIAIQASLLKSTGSQSHNKIKTKRFGRLGKRRGLLEAGGC